MASRLKTFLDERAARPFAWGQDDCSLFIADWWHRVHGVDPAAALRRAYATEAECHALVAAEGGLVRLVGRLAATAGAERTREPHEGDFGVIAAGGRIIGAIAAGDGWWAIRNEQIGFLRDVRVLRAWRI